MIDKKIKTTETASASTGIQHLIDGRRVRKAYLVRHMGTGERFLNGFRRRGGPCARPCAWTRKRQPRKRGVNNVCMSPDGSRPAATVCSQIGAFWSRCTGYTGGFLPRSSPRFPRWGGLSPSFAPRSPRPRPRPRPAP